MTNNQQDAVKCETCGVYRVRIDKSCPHCGADFIPAPVVPSDDRLPVLCVKVQGTGATWVCNRPSYDVVHQNVNNARPGSGKHDFKPPAPPTPSQDAEGDRLLVRDLLDLFAGQVAVHKHMWARLGGQPWWDCPQCREQAALVESAIRADYEELVEAEIARKTAARHMDSRDMMQRIIARRDLVEAEDRIDVALTRIEESLGGRKDA